MEDVIPSIRRIRERFSLSRSTLYSSFDPSSPRSMPSNTISPHSPSVSYEGALVAHAPRLSVTYRARALTYSFEESERSNITQDDLQASDNDSVFSIPCPTARTLYEELRGSSLQSVSATSAIALSPPRESNPNQRAVSEYCQRNLVSEDRRRFPFSSQQVALPPPFSAVPRSISLNTPLPILNSLQSQSQIRFTSTSQLIDERARQDAALITVDRMEQTTHLVSFSRRNCGPSYSVPVR
jgi:hypothetical protein